jgi:myo-inositol-1(or 4)-monophosphatase
MVTEAGGLVGNFSGDADFLEQKECMAGSPRIYGQMVSMFSKYSKVASATEKAPARPANVSGTMAEADAITAAAFAAAAPAANETPAADAPF